MCETYVQKTIFDSRLSRQVVSRGYLELVTATATRTPRSDAVITDQPYYGKTLPLERSQKRRRRLLLDFWAFEIS